MKGCNHKEIKSQEDKDMCRTMKELENAIADYRSLKAMKEQLEEELKAVEREIIGYMDTNEKISETGNDFLTFFTFYPVNLLLKCLSSFC